MCRNPSICGRNEWIEEYRERLPGVAVGKDGKQYQKTEGFRPLRIRNIKFEGEDGLRNGAGATPDPTNP